jgi:hypothetical protein
MSENNSAKIESTITVLSINDVYELVPSKEGKGGLAQFKTLLDRERATAKNPISTLNVSEVSESSEIPIRHPKPKNSVNIFHAFFIIYTN